jgi:hypothetical protein
LFWQGSQQSLQPQGSLHPQAGSQQSPQPQAGSQHESQQAGPVQGQIGGPLSSQQQFHFCPAKLRPSTPQQLLHPQPGSHAQLTSQPGSQQHSASCPHPHAGSQQQSASHPQPP